MVAWRWRGGPRMPAAIVWVRAWRAGCRMREAARHAFGKHRGGRGQSPPTPRVPSLRFTGVASWRRACVCACAHGGGGGKGVTSAVQVVLLFGVLLLLAQVFYQLPQLSTG